MSSDDIVIIASKRTPIGSFQGQFAPVAGHQLGAAAIRASLNQAGIDGQLIDEVIMGCVLPAGQGQAPARQAALGGGLPLSAGCTTINKVCGSGMKAMMLAHDLIRAGSADFIVAGGMESMTNAPYLLPKARSGYRMGHGQVLDHMFLDGLQNPYDDKMMGQFAETCASKYEFSREAQDQFSTTSVERAMSAMENAFKDEITAVTVTTRKGEQVVDQDEEPPRCDLTRIAQLKPAFAKDGTVTAANASKISDGAAATVLTSRKLAEQHGCKPLARILGHANHAQEPEWFTTAPVGAIKKLLQKLNWSVADVDLFEINEAFAVVTMAAMQELDIPHAKVNVYGGACALGHPIGASGTRLVVTLINALRQHGLRRGVAALCIGGGEATAIAVELV
ncbi:MAG: acetyl-CoA C-acyltransferase [Gammaproteobacteria bacterium]|jgi:acetyl-CoA C-acetyltransferase|nr:acetyl-CoA C-acyltransferase [Gammaproteobacteria bacterium]